MKYKYKCPECSKKFSTIKDVNQHVVKTGCNNSKKITIDFYFSDRQISELGFSSYKYSKRFSESLSFK